MSLTRIGGRNKLAASPFTSGGQGIYNDTYRCSLGVNARNSAGQRYFLTAGHCAADAYYKVSGGTRLGTLHEADYGSRYGNDFAIVTYTNSNVSAYGTVWVNGEEKQIASSGILTRE
ncbi:S1 family peptidase [Actinoplanes sp. TRM 88003]|uniref:S1 family peptidase n=1 Tax=Paractinoplanes aksuensis TaxID=2939490 RepID=A0ABT1DSC1_9ACTN|nr:S1 family peptidase [Actinoplanes aksuensis]MCO8273728.1 S1 family peptidase [Actinoplanes aksuensis]